MVRRDYWQLIPLVRVALFFIAGIITAGISVGRAPSGVFAEECQTGVIFILLLLVWLTINKPKVSTVFLYTAVFALAFLLTARRQRVSGIRWPSGKTVFEAVLVSEPAIRGKTARFDAIMTRNEDFPGVDKKTRMITLSFLLDERSARLIPGDGVMARARVESPPSYYLSRNITGAAFVSSGGWERRRVSLTALSLPERARIMMLKYRHRLIAKYRQADLGDDNYAVLAAMTLGDKSSLAKEMKKTYSVTGASHILALSGLHLSIIYIILSGLFGGRRRGTVMLSQLIIISAVWLYTFLVGFTPGILRSAIMLSVMSIIKVSGRDAFSLNVLAFTALVLLIHNPLTLYDISFQMSFMAVASILIVVPIFNRFVSPEFFFHHRLLKWVWSMAVVSIASQIGVAPIIAYYFHHFSTYFLLTNYVVIPLTTVILHSALIFFTLPFLRVEILWLLERLTSALNGFLNFMSALPSASIDGINLSLTRLIIVYAAEIALIALIARSQRRYFGRYSY